MAVQTRTRVTKGKAKNIDACADQHGIIRAAAMDQRGSLMREIGKQGGAATQVVGGVSEMVPVTMMDRLSATGDVGKDRQVALGDAYLVRRLGGNAHMLLLIHAMTAH